MKDSKQVTDGALLLAVFIVLVLVILFVPMIAPLIMFLLPIPFVIYTAEYDWIRSLLLLLGATIVLSIILTNLVSIPITIFASSGGIMIGAALYRNAKPYDVWSRGTIGFIIGLLFTYLFTQYIFDVNWINEIDAMIDESLQMSKDMIEQLGFIEIEEQFEVIEERFANITDLIPAGIAVIAISLAFVAQWLSYKVMNRFNQEKLRFPPFRQFKIPRALVWVYFFALLLTIFDLKPDEIIFIVANNVLILVGFFLALQGLSFIFFYAHYKNWSIAIPIICLLVTILIPLILLYFVRIIGIIDLGFGLRERLKQKRG